MSPQPRSPILGTAGTSPGNSIRAPALRADAGFPNGTLVKKIMKQTLRLPSRLAVASLTSLVSLAALGGCSGGGDSSVSLFDPIATKHSSAASSPVVVEGKWLVYLASEILSGPVPGTNFNPGDVDFNDDCAVVVDMTTKTETDLFVATIAATVVGNEIYLIVSESEDNKDWSVPLNGISGNVLLHYSSTSPLSFVDEIDSGTHSWGVAGGRLYYVRGDTGGVTPGQTSLAYLSTGAPLLPFTVLHTDTLNTLFPEILAVDENLIFLVADEVAEGRDLNGDLLTDDGFVLALLDGTDISSMVQNVGLALENDSTPVRARVTAAHDWLVGFLVNEASQSLALTGLNDAALFGNAWKPSGCTSYADTDTSDHVLHVLSYALWSVNPGLNAPKNTGIPGTDRILCTTNAVATLVLEIDENSLNGGCDLNFDGDKLDKILRWVSSSSLTLPFVSSTQFNAVEDSIPGGSSGISDLAGKLLCVVSESDDNTDHDLDGFKTRNLVAWIDPNAATPTWKFDHNPATVQINSVGASAMSDRKERDRLLVAFQESVFGASINTNGDSDAVDSVPTFALFDPNNPADLDFPGPAGATSAANPGIVIAGGFAIYRVDELADNRDWNGDNFKDDFVLFRTTLSTNFSALIGTKIRSTANSELGPVISSSGNLGAAFLADESMAGVDLNIPTDGRNDGYVVTWFRIGS